MSPTDPTFEQGLKAWASRHAVSLEFLSETPSTNLAAREKPYPGGALVVAQCQTAGRGQRGNRWLSAPGENLTFSVVLRPGFLAPEEQFYLSKVVCLALLDTFDRYGLAAAVKWPNDIYVRGRKAVGILIEHDLCGNSLARSIVGVGINVNQTVFPPELPNPTSLALECGSPQDRLEVLAAFYENLAVRYDALGRGDRAGIDRNYLDRLYLLGRESTFTCPGGKPFRGTITGLRPTGELEVRHRADGLVHAYLFKEIQLLSGTPEEPEE